MKTLYLMPILALAAIDANASDSTAVQADLTLVIPTCEISVAPKTDTIVATYTLEQLNLDNNSAGIYDFPTPAAEYLVSANEVCSSIPAFTINLPAPARASGARVDRAANEHGVSWKTTSFLADILAFPNRDGSGAQRDVVGKYSAKGNDTSGSQQNGTFVRSIPLQYKSYDGTDYTPSRFAAVSTAVKAWSSQTNGPVVANGGYSGYATITPTLQPADTSVLITVGALFDKNGAKVGSQYEQGALVNGLNYGWTNKVTITLI